MPLSFRSIASSSDSGNPTTITVNVPAGTADGDLLVMSVTNFTQNFITGSVVSTPSGWTRLTPISGHGGSIDWVDQGTFYRVASSEPASYTVNCGDGTRVYWCTAAIVAYTGQDSTSIRTSGAVGTTNSQAASPTPVSLAAAMKLGDIGLICYGCSASSSPTPPGGAWSTRLNVVTSALSVTIIDKVDGTDTPVLTNSFSTSWGVSSVAIAAPQGSGNFLPFFM